MGLSRVPGGDMSDYEGSAPIVGGLIRCQRIPISLLCGLFGSSLCSNGALLSERVTQLCDKPPWALRTLACLGFLQGKAGPHRTGHIEVGWESIEALRRLLVIHRVDAGEQLGLVNGMRHCSRADDRCR
jgi:hypothetical protein